VEQWAEVSHPDYPSDYPERNMNYFTSHPSQEIQTNDRKMRYRRLPCEMFTDTLEASAVSWQRQIKNA